MLHGRNAEPQSVSARPAAASAVVAALNRQAMICCLLSMAHGEYSALMRPQLGTEFQNRS